MSATPSSENEPVPGDPVAAPENAVAAVAKDAQQAIDETANAADVDAAHASELADSAAAEAERTAAEAQQIFDGASTVEPAAAPIAAHSPAVTYDNVTPEIVAENATDANEAADLVASSAADAELNVGEDAAVHAEEAAGEVIVSADDPSRTAAQAVAAAMADDDDTPWYDRPGIAEATEIIPESARTADEAPAIVVVEAATAEAETVVAPTVTGVVVEPAVDPLLAPMVSPQPIFVQAPEPPRKRGNRGFAGVVGLIATLIFGVGYLASLLLADGFSAFASTDALGAAARAAVTSWTFWTPVAVFFLGFWLLGTFVNTAKWGYWVIFGLFVGILAFGGHILGAVLQANPWKIPSNEALSFISKSALTIPGFVAFALGRELPIWFGGWIARRGRRVVQANIDAEEEYERTLEAGPQLVQQ